MAKYSGNCVPNRSLSKKSSGMSTTRMTSRQTGKMSSAHGTGSVGKSKGLFSSGGPGRVGQDCKGFSSGIPARGPKKLS